MPKFIIERNVPGAGQLSGDQLCRLSQKSRSVLRELGPDIVWVQSYVADDHLFCVYVAPDAETIREHARRGGFPCDRVIPVRGAIDLATAEGSMTTPQPMQLAVQLAQRSAA
jgi:hypothetical protein